MVLATLSQTTLSDKCQLLLKWCYSVGYNYHIYHWIFSI